MHAVSLFKHGKHDVAIDIFIELDTNPSKVVSLYPGSIAGRLSTPDENWIVLFGGLREDTPTITEPKPSEGTVATEEPQKAKSGEQPISTSASTAPAPDATASLRGYLPNLMRQKDDDTASITSRRGTRRRRTVEIFETFGVSSSTSNSSVPPLASAPTPAPTTDASTQLLPGRFTSTTRRLQL